jgi:hypothetical protein
LALYIRGGGSAESNKDFTVYKSINQTLLLKQNRRFGASYIPINNRSPRFFLETQFLAKEIDQGLRKAGIHVSTPVLAVLCLVFGVLLLIFPDLVGYLIGIFLLIEGILLLVNYMENRPETSEPQCRTEPPPPPPPPPTAEEPPETPPAVPAT